ncbi:MAG: ABC transporter substrate-binding protein, partial [Lachnospiraceae bacterium]
MKKRSKTAAILLAGVMALSMTACGGTATETTAETSAETTAETTAEAAAETSAEAAAETDGKVFKIGVLQLTQHDALDKANEGFFAALDDAGVAYEAD